MVAYFTRDDNERLLEVLYDTQMLTMLPGGGQIHAGSRAVRAGDLVSRYTGGTRDKKFIVAKQSQLRVALGAASTSVQVDDAHPFEIGDELRVGTHSSQAITAIDYDSNTITIEAAAGAGAINTNVYVDGNNGHRVVAIALLPSKDRNSPSLSPLDGDSYLTAALTGRFKGNRLLNFSNNSDHYGISDLAGRYQIDANHGNGLYIVDRVSATFAL